MTDLEKAARMALEALELRCSANSEEREPYGAITALRQALEQPAQQELLQEIARLHDRIKDLESDVEFLLQPAQDEPVTLRGQLAEARKEAALWQSAYDTAMGVREPLSDEPVAWRIEYEVCAGGKNRGSSLKKFDYGWDKCSFVSENKDAEIDAFKWRNRKETPLYTRPQAREPLTDEQRREVINKSWNDFLRGKEDGTSFSWYLSFAIEASHGIKGGA